MGNNLEKKYVEIPQEIHPPLEIDFDSLLAELRDLESQPIMSPNEVWNLWAEIGKRNILEANKKFSDHDNIQEFADVKQNNLFCKTVERIQNECGEESHFNAIADILSAVKEGDLKEYTSEDKVNAIYNHLTGDIVVGKGKVSTYPYGMLRDLACFGYGLDIVSIHHEYIHKKQSREPKQERRRDFVKNLIMKIIFSTDSDWIKRRYLDNRKQKLKRKKILGETHAYKGSEKYSLCDIAYSTNALAEQIKTHEFFQKSLLSDRKDLDQLISASIAVKRLYALGLGDEEIGALVKKAKWDDGITGYDKLKNKVKKLMDEKNLEEEDVDNLVLADDIKRKIYINKVRLIAQDELRKAFGNIPKQPAQ